MPLPGIRPCGASANVPAGPVCGARGGGRCLEGGSANRLAWTGLCSATGGRARSRRAFNLHAMIHDPCRSGARDGGPAARAGVNLPRLGVGTSLADPASRPHARRRTVRTQPGCRPWPQDSLPIRGSITGTRHALPRWQSGCEGVPGFCRMADRPGLPRPRPLRHNRRIADPDPCGAPPGGGAVHRGGGGPCPGHRRRRLQQHGGGGGPRPPCAGGGRRCGAGGDAVLQQAEPGRALCAFQGGERCRRPADLHLQYPRRAAWWTCRWRRWRSWRACPISPE